MVCMGCEERWKQCADGGYEDRQKYYKTEDELEKMKKPMYVL